MKVRTRIALLIMPRSVGRGHGRAARQRDHLSGHRVQEPGRVPGRDLRRAPCRPRSCDCVREGASRSAVRGELDGSRRRTGHRSTTRSRTCSGDCNTTRWCARASGPPSRSACSRSSPASSAGSSRPRAAAGPVDHEASPIRRHTTSPRCRSRRAEDELKDLADTFDDMLDRLEQSFVAQRRFSAEVSHELRTPLAVVRSEADILRAEAESDATRATADNIKTATCARGTDHLVAPGAGPGRERPHRRGSARAGRGRR